MSTLILYYSYGGNTRSVAERMQRALDCDICEIETEIPYGGSYDHVVDQGHDEVNRGFEPEIKALACDPADYDTVLIGTPVWWYTYAPAVKTVLSDVDWSGKAVHPFATNGGWIGHTFEDFEASCAGADVGPGLNVRFDEDVQRTSNGEIDRWARSIEKS